MGRRERKNVDYFPFFIKDGRTLFILEGKYQCKGTGFFTNVFRFLAGRPDHHFQLKSESDHLYFFTATKCDEESGIDMIEIMVETGKLERDLWEQKKVLASQDFLESIQDAYRKRINNCITIDETKVHYGITTGRNEYTGAKLPEEIHKGEDNYRKLALKERKGKERKEEEKKITGAGNNKEQKNPPFFELPVEQQETLNTLTLFLQSNKIFPDAIHFRNEMIEEGINPKTIIHAFERAKIKKTFDKVRGGVKAYCRKIINVEDGNFNEAESIKKHNDKKSDTKIHSKIKSVIGSIGERV